MEPDFWLERWSQRQIGFHLGVVHPLLRHYLPHLDPPSDAPLFLPLCGKTVDIHYLLSLKHPVIGVELSEKAVGELFDELGVQPAIDDWQGGRRWRSGSLTVFQGDFFELGRADVGPVGAVYDRAALVALPPAMRESYARHLTRITDKAPQLLITFEYDQTRMEGPPFSVEASEIQHLYGDDYGIETLSRKDIIDKAERFRELGLHEFVEGCYLLR